MRKYGLLILLALLGLMLIFFDDKVRDTVSEAVVEKDNRPVIATLESYDGDVNFKIPKTLYYRKVKEELELRSLDTIVTGESSTAVIKFLSGFKLEISPNSIIVVEEPQAGSDGVVRVTFLRGDFRVIDQGSEGKLVVSKDDILQEAGARPVQKPLAITKTVVVAPPPTTPPPIPSPIIKAEELEEIKTVQKPTPKPTPKKPRETLPDEYISQTIKKQTPLFNRCYAEHLRLNPNARGRISLAFTIAPLGSVSSVRVLGSTLRDPKLEQCTVSVIERTRFRKFDGDPIIVNYPINFE